MIMLSAHHYYQQNKYGRDFFVGDIHGKYRVLMQALDKLNFDFSADRLFSVGDVIDRGEAAFKCLCLAQQHWFIPVLGNHELFLMEAEHGNIHTLFSWYQNGGGWWQGVTAQQQQLAKNIVANNFSLTLSVATLAGKVGVVHAQYPFSKWPINAFTVNNDILYQLVWSRDCVTNDYNKAISGIDFIVSGHTPLNKALLKGQQLFIDTGCGYLPYRAMPSPHLTICEFKKDHIGTYAVTENIFRYSEIEI